MENETKCGFAVCHCRTAKGSLFCSADCEQAAAQGVERDFCQCAHEGCVHESRESVTIDLVGRDGIGSAQVTIEFSTKEDLVQQLFDLADALAAQANAERTATRATASERFPAGSQGMDYKVQSHSA